jgi:hypothetical protein
MSKTTAVILLALMGLVCLGLVGGCKKQEGEWAPADGLQVLAGEFDRAAR